MKLLLFLILMYGVYLAGAYFFQRQVIFPRGLAEIPAGKIPPGVERLWLDPGFGKVEAWYLPPETPEPAAPALLFAHGNAELIDYWPGYFRPFADRGIGVMLVEYPGYGRSAGVPTETSVTETFVAAYDELSRKSGVDPARIVPVGRSLGGGAVCRLIEKRPAAALVLMSTFTGIREMSRRFFIPGFVVRDPFHNIGAVRSYEGPVLVVHGTRDTLVPVSHGRRLAAAASRGALVTFDCGHNDCPPDTDRFVGTILRFLQDAGIVGGS